MTQPRAVLRNSGLWLGLAPMALVLLAFAFPASSSTAFYANEEAMSCTTNPFNRYTFMVGPGICQLIPRQQFTQPPLVRKIRSTSSS
jgi:hypothetical protein